MMYYSASMNILDESLMNAVKEGKLLESSRTNIRLLLDGTRSPIAREAVEELAAAGEWQELNDRFYKTLAFGTGGLRGRTIGSIVTRAEQGNGGVNGRPEYPCVGTACMNYFNVGRAMRGLIIYVNKHVEATDPGRKPRLVIGHDTRHFPVTLPNSAQKSARTWDVTFTCSTAPAPLLKFPLPSGSFMRIPAWC